MFTDEDPELWLRDYARQAEEMSERAKQVQLEFQSLQGEASNPYVFIRLTPGGSVEEIRFTSKIRSVTPDELAEQVKDAYALALSKVNLKAQQLVSSIGPGTDEMADFIGQALTPEMRERAERLDRENH